MKILVVVSTIVAAFPLSSAKAQMTGNDYARRCEAESGSFNSGVCSGWAVGFLEGLDAVGAACYPAGVENGQLKAVVLQYVNDHPSERHLPIYKLALRAFVEAWPCKK